jgi:hypothetical protein
MDLRGRLSFGPTIGSEPGESVTLLSSWPLVVTIMGGRAGDDRGNSAFGLEGSS